MMKFAPALDGVRAGWDLLDAQRPLPWFQDWNRSVDPGGLVSDACRGTAAAERSDHGGSLREPSPR